PSSFLLVFGLFPQFDLVVILLLALVLLLDDSSGLFARGFGRGRYDPRDRRADTRGVFRHRLLGPLDEVGPLPLGRQLGGPGFGRLLLRILERGHWLERVVQDGPDDPHSCRRLGRARGFGLGLGRRFGFLLGFTLCYLLVRDLLDDLVGLILHG